MHNKCSGVYYFTLITLFLDGSDSSEGNVFFETDLATLDEKEEVGRFQTFFFTFNYLNIYVYKVDEKVALDVKVEFR